MNITDIRNWVANLPQSFQAVPILGVGGVSFIVGNLLLANALSPEDFGATVLYVVFVQLAQAIAPLGCEMIVIRRLLGATPALLKRTLASSTCISILLSIFVYSYYDLSAILSLMLAANCLLAALTRVGAAVFQANHRVIGSVVIMQVHNVVMVLVGVAALLIDSMRPVAVCSVILIGYLVTSIYSWQPSKMAVTAGPLTNTWREGVGLVSVGLALLLLIQLERLIIPKTLDIYNLAIFAVYAAIYIAPFRMYQLAIYFVFPARIRRETSRLSRRQLISSEVARSVVICSAMSVTLWLIGPYIVSVFKLDDYPIDKYLIGACLVSGVVKVLSTIGISSITATGSDSHIRTMSTASWLILATSVPLGYYGSQWGLAGVVFAVAISWTIYGAVGFWLQIENLQRSPATVDMS